MLWKPNWANWQSGTTYSCTCICTTQEIEYDVCVSVVTAVQIVLYLNSRPKVSQAGKKKVAFYQSQVMQFQMYFKIMSSAKTFKDNIVLM